MTNKKKEKTGIFIDCPCGARAAVFKNGECKWFAHCPGCGRLTFWANPQIFERVKAGAKLCGHNPEPKICKGGHSETTWCKACRVRVFIPLP